jgi:hypothetical protein
MNRTLTTLLGTAALAMGSVSVAQAALWQLNTSDTSNGIYDIYSSTFDGGLSPCTGSSPPQCAFFGGDPGSGRAISIAPNPTGVANLTPAATGYVGTPPTGSYLDMTLSGGNTSLTINGGVVALPALTLTIAGTTVVTTAPGAGFVLDSGAHTTSVNGLGQAVLQVNLSPLFAADFSTLGAVVTGCTGPLCGLLGVLSLDMVRYDLRIQFNPTFTDFTSKFEGQTANNSLIFANLNTPLPGAAWLFGSALGLLGVARRRSA